MMKVKIYEKKSDKVIDFLIGFILVPAVFAATVIFLTGIKSFATNSYLYFIIFIAEIAGVYYSGNKRRYIAIGVLYFLLAIPLVALGTCLLAASGVRFG